jgi:uncharacterized protein (TIGR02147 family)
MKQKSILKKIVSPEDFLFFADFLNEVYIQSKNKNPNFSLRSLAHKLGYENPSFVSDVLKKKRKPTLEMVKKTAQFLHLSNKDTEYLVLICLFEKAKSHEEKEDLLAKIRVLLSKRKWKYIDLNYLDFLKNWEVIQIYNMIGLKDFRMTDEYINSRSQVSIDKKLILNAEKILLELNLIEKIGDKKYRYHNQNSVMGYGDQGVKTQALMSYHMNNFRHLLKIYPELDYNERDVRSSMMSIQRKDIPEVLKIINECHQKIMSLGVDANGEETILFNSQLIPITKKFPFSRD